jgi:uncharacterized protein
MILKVKIQPNSSKNEICEKLDIEGTEYYKIKIKAPAVDNKANLELLNFLSKILQISKSSIKISKGEKNKLKILDIEIDEFSDKFENYKRIFLDK